MNLTSKRQIKLMVGAHCLWLGTVCLLGSWWGRVILKQAEQITDLERRLGVTSNVAQTYFYRTQRMLYWESVSFFALLLGCSALLIGLYWRDVRRVRSVHAFFASVTHELRTPLTSIRLQAESLAEALTEGRPPVASSNLVERLLEDTQRLEGQVERALELARIEGGGPVYAQPLRIKPWVDRFLSTWGSDYRDKLECQTQVEDLLIEADPVALQVIFKNLLENSMKHSLSKKPRIQISTLKTQDQGILLSVKDNGNGYEGDLKQLGTLFQKGSSSHGTGVGLYLAKALMKKMGGRIRFQNQSGQAGERDGFEATLWFPEGAVHG